MVPRMPAPRVAPVVSAGLFWTVTSQPGSEPTISTVSLQFSSLPSPQVLRSEPGVWAAPAAPVPMLRAEAPERALAAVAWMEIVLAGAGGPGVGAGLVLEPVARAVAPVLVVAGELLDVLAGTVAGAGVGAGGTAAALALVAVEALALAGLAV